MKETKSRLATFFSEGFHGRFTHRTVEEAPSKRDISPRSSMLSCGMKGLTARTHRDRNNRTHRSDGASQQDTKDPKNQKPPKTPKSKRGHRDIKSKSKSKLSTRFSRATIDSQQSQTEVRKYMKRKSLTMADFEILELIGKGTFGKVQLCVYKPTEKKNTADLPPLAIKSMRKRVLLEKKQITHVASERKVLSSVHNDCPHVVQLYGCFQDSTYLHFIMEYVSGGELFTRIVASRAKTGRGLKDNVARFYFVEVASALHYLHSKNVVYRDLKPENILITYDGHIKLIDFGFAMDLSSLSSKKTMTLCGTPEYLAPEVIQGKPHGCDVDLWALGVLLYELITTNTPFASDEGPKRIYELALKGNITYPSNMTAYCKDMIKKLCRTQPSKRIRWDRGNDIRNHNFVKERYPHWEDVLNMSTKPPWVPPSKGPLDTQNFNKYTDSFEEPENSQEILDELFLQD